MKMTIKFAIGCCVLLAAPTTFACDYPERPVIPDGATVSKDEMLAGVASVNKYLAGVDDYLTCIENEEKDTVAALENPDPEDLKRRDEELSRKFDAANAEKVLVGEEMNLQVRTYNAARKAAE